MTLVGRLLTQEFVARFLFTLIYFVMAGNPRIWEMLDYPNNPKKVKNSTEIVLIAIYYRAIY